MNEFLRRRMFARSIFLQAFWNGAGMQSIGFLYALEPALRRAYSKPAERRDAALRNLEYFNTQPYMVGFSLGVAAGMEEYLAHAEEPLRPALSARLVAVKKALAAGLAAIGDRLFWGALRPACAVTAVFLWGLLWTLNVPHPVLAGSLAVLAAFNATALRARWEGLSLGYQRQERVPEALTLLPWTRWAEPVRRSAFGLAAACAAFCLIIPPTGKLSIWNPAILACCWVLRARGISVLRLCGGLCALGCARALWP